MYSSTTVSSGPLTALITDLGVKWLLHTCTGSKYRPSVSHRWTYFLGGIFFLTVEHLIDVSQLWSIFSIIFFVGCAAKVLSTCKPLTSQFKAEFLGPMSQEWLKRDKYLFSALVAAGEKALTKEMAPPGSSDYRYMDGYSMVWIWFSLSSYSALTASSFNNKYSRQMMLNPFKNEKC